MLIAALSTSDDRPLDINALPEPTINISRRDIVDAETMIDTALLTHEEAAGLRSSFYSTAPDFEAAHALGPRFHKVHDAYTLTSGGEPVIGRMASAAILLVRDPRDVAPSLAAHFGRTVDWTLDFMGRADASLGGWPDDRLAAFLQRLLTWSDHAASWFEQQDVPVHLVKYESLLADPVATFLGAMHFAGRAVTRDDAERAVTQTRFDTLQAQERKHGFVEAPRQGRPFFAHGRSGRWREVLTGGEIARIEADHAKMMGRLGYEITTCPLEMPDRV
jgi:aryl sulfotransferase